MVIHLLDRYLPIELTDKIYKQVHQSCMRDICEIINYKIVFTLYWMNENDNFNYDKAKMSFLVCENQNYYMCLDTDQYSNI